jgi:Arc/MetJ family transcription regulator
MRLWFVDIFHKDLAMRTTIEITEEQRAELLKMAANRGLKGFSQVVQEALNEYIVRQNERFHLVKDALKLKGILSDKEGNDLEETRKVVRGSWR